MINTIHNPFYEQLDNMYGKGREWMDSADKVVHIAPSRIICMGTNSF